VQTLSDQPIGLRRILFGPLQTAFAALELAGPVALLGTPRSLAAIDDDALPGLATHRFDGVRQHNPRAVVEAAGIHNVMTKSLGSANSHNVVRAAFTALQLLRDPAAVARLRGKDVEEFVHGTR